MASHCLARPHPLRWPHRLCHLKGGVHGCPKPCKLQRLWQRLGCRRGPGWFRLLLRGRCLLLLLW